MSALPVRTSDAGGVNIEDHQARHILLHKMLNELVADYLTHTLGRAYKNTIGDLMQWSKGQTVCPTVTVEQLANSNWAHK